MALPFTVGKKLILCTEDDRVAPLQEESSLLHEMTPTADQDCLAVLRRSDQHGRERSNLLLGSARVGDGREMELGVKSLLLKVVLVLAKENDPSDQCRTIALVT